jgi:hypothetical protein
VKSSAALACHSHSPRPLASRAFCCDTPKFLFFFVISALTCLKNLFRSNEKKKLSRKWRKVQ